jgi:hypothetical protein
MPIIDYRFQDRLFFAKEIGDISAEDAQTWADKLNESAALAGVPIVALVDALDVKNISVRAIDIFAKASYTHHVIAVVVATNAKVRATSTNIGLLGKRNQTVVFHTLEQAHEHALKLLEQKGHSPSSSP